MPHPSGNSPTASSRQVWRLAWPNIISNLLFTLVGFIHIKIVAQLGTSSVAAVTTGHRVFFLVQAILMGVSVASTAMVARSWGGGRPDQANMVTWTSVWLGGGLALAISLPVIAAPRAIASLFGLDAETTALAASFIFWLSMFNVFSALSMMLSTGLRAIGDVITPLWFLSLSSILNVSFAYMLAFGIGPLPQLGVTGVAAGGGFGASLVTCMFFAFWWFGRLKLKPVRGSGIDRLVVRRLFAIGAPAVLEQGIVQLAFLAFFAIVARYGTSAFAAYGIGASLVAFPIVIGFGFGIATATLVGQQLGSGHSELAVQSTVRSLRMALIAMIALSILLAWWAEPLARFMIDDPDVVHLTQVFIYVIALAQPLMAVEFVLGGALRGAGDTRPPLLATFYGIILGRLIPALIILWLGLSVYWVFAVMLLDYCIKATLLYQHFRSRAWLNARADINMHNTAAHIPAGDN